MAKAKAVREEAPGRVLRAEKNGKTRVIRTTGKRWSQEKERIFLEELAATCNIRAAADAVGFSTTAIYRRRMLWPGFAAAWGEALEQGYARLETMLIERATDSLNTQPIDGVRQTPAMSTAEALNLLKLHRASVRGGAPQNYAWRTKAPNMDEVRASILRKIAAIKRARARKEAAGQG